MAPGSSRARTGEPHPGPGEALERVARALGVPVATFFPDADRADPSVIQTADLVTAFAAIANPAARRTCLAFVRAMASS